MVMLYNYGKLAKLAKQIILNKLVKCLEQIIELNKEVCEKKNYRDIFSNTLFGCKKLILEMFVIR